MIAALHLYSIIQSVFTAFSMLRVPCAPLTTGLFAISMVLPLILLFINKQFKLYLRPCLTRYLICVVNIEFYSYTFYRREIVNN